MDPKREPTGPRPKTFLCPHCGAEVRMGAPCCPECGSDETTGWAEDAGKWEADIPTGGYGGDPGFDYDEFTRREFPRAAPRTMMGLAPRQLAQLAVGLGLAALLLALFLFA